MPRSGEQVEPFISRRMLVDIYVASDPERFPAYLHAVVGALSDLGAKRLGDAKP